MSTPRKKRSSRIGSRQTNRYFHFLESPLRLVTRTDPATQENRSSKDKHANALSGGRRSTDSDLLELYDHWLSLSPREQDVTFLTCMGYKNQQIALHMGISAGTVKSYLQNVFNKFGLHSKTELRLKFHNFDFKRNTPPYR
ncbi:MAG TPA: LuxR C-terminal-related transcriptional regulator [Anaerolineales bacterium]|nr:LuxR C-terminal-related transcriptional regulator [Anaerolineales bacterium]